MEEIMDRRDYHLETIIHLNNAGDARSTGHFKREVVLAAKKLFQFASEHDIDLIEELNIPTFPVELEMFWSYEWDCPKCNMSNETRSDPDKDPSFCSWCNVEGQNYEMECRHEFECPLCEIMIELEKEEEDDDIVECPKCGNQYEIEQGC